MEGVRAAVTQTETELKGKAVHITYGWCRMPRHGTMRDRAVQYGTTRHGRRVTARNGTDTNRTACNATERNGHKQDGAGTDGRTASRQECGSSWLRVGRGPLCLWASCGVSGYWSRESGRPGQQVPVRAATVPDLPSAQSLGPRLRTL